MEAMLIAIFIASLVFIAIGCSVMLSAKRKYMHTKRQHTATTEVPEQQQETQQQETQPQKKQDEESAEIARLKKELQESQEKTQQAIEQLEKERLAKTEKAEKAKNPTPVTHDSKIFAQSEVDNLHELDKLVGNDSEIVNSLKRLDILIGDATKTEKKEVPPIQKFAFEEVKKQWGKDYIFAEYKDGYVLQKYIGTDAIVKIPDCFTSIADDAFRNNSAIVQVEIPNSITKIGCTVFFGCKNLKLITIPNSVERFSSDAFSHSGYDLIIVGEEDSYARQFYELNSEYLTYRFLTPAQYKHEIEIEKQWGRYFNIGKTKNGYVLKGYKGMTSVVNVPDFFVRIGDSALKDNKTITKVVLPESVTIIENYAFWSCDNLEVIVIPRSVVSIGSLPFSSRRDLVIVGEDNSYAYEYCVSNGLKFQTPTQYELEASFDAEIRKQWGKDYGIAKTKDGYVLQKYKGTDTTVKIPEFFVRIGDNAFKDNKSITQVVLPKSITSIGNYAFWGCDNLKLTVVPNSVVNIGNLIFSFIYGLIVMGVENSYVQEYCKSNVIAFTTPEEYKNKLQEKLDEEQRKQLEAEEKERQQKLEAIRIENERQQKLEAKRIEDERLLEEKIEKERKQKEEADRIEKEQLKKERQEREEAERLENERQQKLEANRIKKEQREKERQEREESEQLEKKRILAEKAELLEKKRIEREHLEEDWLAEGLQSFTIKDEVTVVPMLSAKEQFLTRTVIIARDCRKIADNATKNLHNLEDVIFEGSPISIGKHAFAGSDLREIHIPNKVTHIHEGAFANCANLEKVTGMENVGYIHERAFENCTKLKEIIFSPEIFSIKDAFRGCVALERFVVPEANEGIVLFAVDFLTCKALKKLYLPKQIDEFKCDTSQTNKITLHLKRGSEWQQQIQVAAKDFLRPADYDALVAEISGIPIESKKSKQSKQEVTNVAPNYKKSSFVTQESDADVSDIYPVPQSNARTLDEFLSGTSHQKDSSFTAENVERLPGKGRQYTVNVANGGFTLLNSEAAITNNIFTVAFECSDGTLGEIYVLLINSLGYSLSTMKKVSFDSRFEVNLELLSGTPNGEHQLILATQNPIEGNVLFNSKIKVDIAFAVDFDF